MTSGWKKKIFPDPVFSRVRIREPFLSEHPDPLMILVFIDTDPKDLQIRVDFKWFMMHITSCISSEKVGVTYDKLVGWIIWVQDLVAQWISVGIGESEKKVFLLVALPLRGVGVKALATKKKELFLKLEKKSDFFADCLSWKGKKGMKIPELRIRVQFIRIRLQ